MNIIAQSLYKLSNISKNIKSMLNIFSDEQIIAVQNIINICYSHAIKNGVVLNTKLVQLFNKLNAKNKLNVEDGKIKFNKINYIVNIDYYAKLYSSYIDKIVTYLSKNIKNVQQWNDLFSMINSNVLDNLTSTKSVFVQKNQLSTAEQIQLLIENSALNNIILSDINRIDFVDGEQKTMEAVRAKMATGNKHQQIRNSDMEILVDVSDIKTILKNNIQDNLNKNNQSSAID